MGGTFVDVGEGTQMKMSSAFAEFVTFNVLAGRPDPLSGATAL